MKTINDLKDLNIVRGAVQIAIQKARLYGTKLAVRRGGKVIFETPEEFEKNRKPN